MPRDVTKYCGTVLQVSVHDSYHHNCDDGCRCVRFLFMIEHVMPLCLTISWVYTVAMLVQSIVYEKEQRLKEVIVSRLCDRLILRSHLTAQCVRVRARN